MVCHRVCDYDHHHQKEEERLTTMVTTIGEKAQGEGCHYDTTTRMTSMITATQDRLQERSEKRTTTSSDYIIRLTDRLRVFGAKMTSCFSQFWLGEAFSNVSPALGAFRETASFIVVSDRHRRCVKSLQKNQKKEKREKNDNEKRMKQKKMKRKTMKKTKTKKSKK